MAETFQTLKRKRGRPRKTTYIDAATAVGEQLLPEAALAAGDEEKKEPLFKSRLADADRNVQVPDSQALSDDDSVLEDAVRDSRIVSGKPTSGVPAVIEETVKKKRGRPRKSIPAIPSTTATAGEPVAKRPRGRPRKYANEEERKAVQKQYREAFKARQAALFDQQSERDETSEVELTTAPVTFVREALRYPGRVGGINELIANARPKASSKRKTSNDNTAIDDPPLEYESAHEHPPPNQIYQQLKAKLAAMNVKLASMMERQREQEAEIDELKKWREESRQSLNGARDGKEAGPPDDDDNNDNDYNDDNYDDKNLESEDGDVIGGSQAPFQQQAHRTATAIPPAQALASTSTHPNPPTNTTTNPISTTKTNPTKISTKWSKAARKVYAILANPDINSNGVNIREIGQMIEENYVALSVKEVEEGVADLERHGFVHATVDAFTFALS